ncbi:MAG TPA: hypothetical protein VMU14_11550 [Acidimicrobiales bacterium]|nr:hypothetical protein [Acidimicrobiales bacterium]
MTALEHQNPRTEGRLALRAWIAVAMIPVGWMLVLVAGFAGGEGEHAGTALASVLPALVALAAPTAAVLLGVGAARARQRTGWAAAWAAGVLLVATAVLLPVLVISPSIGWGIAVVVVVAVLAFFEWRYRRSAPAH